MLTSKERAELRSQATTLDTTLIVGKSGITDALIAAKQPLQQGVGFQIRESAQTRLFLHTA